VNQAQSTLISLIIGVFIFNLFNVGLTWARQNMILFIGNKIDNTLAIKVMNKLFHLPIHYFQKRATGTIISRVHAVESIREFLSGTFMTLVLDIPFVLIFLVIMFYYSITLSLITILFVSIMMLLSIIFAPLIRKKALEQAKISGHNQAFVTEYVGAMETVKSLQIETHLLGEYKRNFGHYLSKTKETRILAINYNSIMSWLEQTLNLVILGTGAYLSMTGTEFTIGMLIAFQMFASRVTQPLLRVSNVWQEFQQTQISMIRLKDIMDQETEDNSIIKANIIDAQGEIKINNLSFKYEEHLPFVYEDLNLMFPPKSLSVITGPSGCGKSTLTKLLQGFYQNYQGNIQIDGINIKQMGIFHLRKYFGIVPQETTLFAGTILNNFKLVNPLINLDDVVALCKMVGIHEAISGLPEQYNTYLGEKGAGLSGGQKQRIAIARALSKKPKILIFDESISSLDEKSKQLVCETIKSLNGQITMIFITHIELKEVGPHLRIDMSKLNKK
jgi:subfamily B ATP-binding cassette protein HlyB/CyaB